MKYVEIGVCPMCNRPLKAYILPSGKTIPMSCECERQKRRDIEDRREKFEKKMDADIAEKKFLETIGERYRTKTLRNYKPDPQGRDKEHLHLINAMSKNFKTFLNKGIGGVVIGNYGCGKTHLEVGLARNLIRKGYSVKMYGASTLYTDYMSAYSWRLAYSPTDVIRKACDADLLILDDVGINTLDTDKDNFIKFFYELINYRYNQKKPILISTNLKQGELQVAITPRIFDRIKAMTYCVVNEAPSMRPKENTL